MIGCLRTCVRKQPIIALYFEFETVLKFYNLGAWIPSTPQLWNTTELAEAIDRGRQTDMIILDFSKAFDRVPHLWLLEKIHHYGIRGSTYNWIRSFLQNRNQQVVVDGATSDKMEVISGVPQGTVLGPLLLLMVINDLPDTVTSNTRLFADDCIIYHTVKSIQDCLQLQEDLRELATWEET